MKKSAPVLLVLTALIAGAQTPATSPACAWIFHEMFRHSDLYQMAAQTFATSLLTRDTPHPPSAK